MRARSLPRRPVLLCLVLLVSGPARGAAQEPDSVPPAPLDTLGQRDTLPPPPGDPRLTWLGDTLSAADTVRPKFSALPEVFPDSLVDPYVPFRPGAGPAWVLTGDQLVGRSAYSLLDVLESEAPVLADDLGGPGLPAFLGSPMGTWTDVQVVVDGVPVGGPLTVAWDLRQIPVEGIARVAWYPGPQVADWGGAGTGGVLAITTRRALAPTSRSHLAFHLGSFDAQAFSGSFARSVTSRGRVFLAANFDDSEGFTRQGDFTRNQLLMKLGWRFGERHLVEIARLSDGLSGEASRANVVGDQNQDESFVHAFYRGAFGPVAARAHWFREEHEIDRNFSYREVPGLVGASDREGVRGEVTVTVGELVAWGSAAREDAEVASLHAAFQRPDGTSLFDPPPEDDPGAARLVNPRELAEWGGGVGWGGPGSPVAGHVSLRRASFGDAAEDGTDWQAELAGRPLPELTLRASAGRAERPADVMGQGVLEVLAAEGLEIHPGRAATPRALERWTGWRAGATWSRPGWRVGGRVFGASGDGVFLWSPPSSWLYFDRGSVATVTLGEPPFNTFDVVDLSVSGLEAEAVVPLPWWDLEGRATFRRLDATEDLTGQGLPYVPRNQGLGQLRYASRFFPSRDLLVEGRLTGRYVGERGTVGEETLPAYLVADLLVQATIINFTISVSFKNLVGTAYRNEEEFFLPETEGYLGIFWRFRE